MTLSLLTDPVLRARFDGASTQVLTVPDLLHAIGRCQHHLDLVLMRPHQTHAVHAFLCQVAALCLLERKATWQDLTIDDWRAALIGLSPAGAAAWDLVSATSHGPAFLQAPTSVPLKIEGATPDALDIPITGRSWEVKEGSIQFAQPDHWIYSLITGHTCAGFGGAGLYGTFRQNGGYASRTGLSLAPAQGGWASHIRRDTAVLVRSVDTIASTHGYSLTGHRLLWSLPWSGTESVAVSALHPYAIEVTRLTRLVRQPSGKITFRRSPTKAARVAGKELAGNVGDPWLPLVTGKEKDRPSALAIRQDGYSVRQMLILLADLDISLPLTARLQEDDPQDLAYVGWGVAREKGATMGVHETVYRVDPAFRAALASTEGRTAIRTAAADLQADILHARTKALFAGLNQLFREGAVTDPRINRFTNDFTARTNEALAPHLTRLLASPGNRPAWRSAIAPIVDETLESAIAAMPLQGGRRYRAIAAAMAFAKNALRDWTTAPASPALEESHA